MFPCTIFIKNINIDYLCIFVCCSFLGRLSFGTHIWFAWASIYWWWYLGRMRLSEPCFPEIFWTPWPFSLFSPPNTLLSVLMLLPYLPLRCSLHRRTYDSLRPSTLLTLHLSLSSWDCDVIVSSDLNLWQLCHSWLCVALKISGKQGSERHFLPTFIIRSPEARSFCQPSGMFIFLEVASRGLMTVSFLATLSKFRPHFFSDMFLFIFSFQGVFQIVWLFLLFFQGTWMLTKTHLTLWCLIGLLSPIHPSKPMILFILFWWWRHRSCDFLYKQRTIGLFFFCLHKKNRLVVLLCKHYLIWLQFFRQREETKKVDRVSIYK